MVLQQAVLFLTSGLLSQQVRLQGHREYASMKQVYTELEAHASSRKSITLSSSISAIHQHLCQGVSLR